MGFETATLKDEEFLHLREGGFFELILKHPDVELYRSSDKTFVMRIPGVGAVQMAAQKG